MKKSPVLIIVVSILLVVSACQRPSAGQIEKLPGIDLSLDRMNEGLGIFLVPTETSIYKMGEHIGLFIENLSSSPVVVNQKEGIKLFAFRQGSWEPIDNEL